MVLGLGVVSLAADMVYEGARSVTGLTAVGVPLLALTPLLATGGAVLASVLLLLERFGKAVRSPSKSVLLARAAQDVGLGRGFGVHKAMDQVGAFVGPLLVAAVLAGTGSFVPSLAVLAVPGALAMVLLVVMRRLAPDDDPAPAEVRPRAATGPLGWLAPARDLPGEFWVFAAGAAAVGAGLTTFAVISYHLVDDELLAPAVVPVVYAGAMLAAAVGALVVGALHDRFGPRAVLVVPVLVAAVPPLAFGAALPAVLTGVGLWGLAGGVLDSTVKARVAELVHPGRRATAYGWFAAVQGVAAVVGGVLAGAWAADALGVLVVVVAVLQVVALVLLARGAGPVRRAGG